MKTMSKAAAASSTSSAAKAEENFGGDLGFPAPEIKQEVSGTESAAAGIDLSLTLGGLYSQMEEIRSPLITQGSSSSMAENGKEVKGPLAMINVVKNDTNIAAMDLFKFMPSVKTVGDKPNGKHIEGFLSNYESGPITIVCVCHGRMMSASEFVQHAGGEGLDNPLRFIKVLTAL